MEIKNALSDDLPSILSLQKSCYRQEAEIYDDFSIPPLTQTTESIFMDFKKELFLKATEEGNIIGSVRAFEERQVCHIGRLIVNPENQNQGVGRQLMTAIENAFPTSRKFQLFTGHKSLKNLSFYNKLGYKEFKRESIADHLTLVFLEKFKSR